MILSLFLFTACVETSQPQLTSSATILIKTPQMKFYDKGFIFKYKEYTQVQIFNAGTAILDMKIYDDRVCRSTFKCQDLKTFNKENLASSYPDNFLKELFERNQKEVSFKDKENGVFIKIIRD